MATVTEITVWASRVKSGSVVWAEGAAEIGLVAKNIPAAQAEIMEVIKNFIMTLRLSMTKPPVAFQERMQDKIIGQNCNRVKGWFETEF
jgi:hypothetical protein